MARNKRLIVNILGARGPWFPGIFMLAASAKSRPLWMAWVDAKLTAENRGYRHHNEESRPGLFSCGGFVACFRDGADFATARDKMFVAAVSSTNVLNDPEPI